MIDDELSQLNGFFEECCLSETNIINMMARYLAHNEGLIPPKNRGEALNNWDQVPVLAKKGHVNASW